MEDYQIRHYIWELSKVFCPVLITVLAMWFIDSQNTKRWSNDGYLKRKIELEIEIRKILLNIKKQIDLLPKLNQFDYLINKKLTLQDLELLNEINSNIGIIHWRLFEKNTKKLNKDYNIEPLIDEYIIFYKAKKQTLIEFKDIYETFLNFNPIKNEYSDLQILDEDLLNENLQEYLQTMYTTCYVLKKQTNKLLQIIEENFEVINKKLWWQFWKK
jgi:hypothetical protein